MQMSWEELKILTEYRWGPYVLRELRRTDGCKFVTLVERLKANDVTIRRLLAFLIENGLVMRNPGYGHPARPEYILTPSGESSAASSELLLAKLEKHSLEHLLNNRHALPLLVAIGGRHLRFAEIKTLLAVTPRSLSLLLNELQNQRLLVREVTTNQPPQVKYSLSGSALKLVGDLA